MENVEEELEFTGLEYTAEEVKEIYLSGVKEGKELFRKTMLKLCDTHSLLNACLITEEELNGKR